MDCPQWDFNAEICDGFATFPLYEQADQAHESSSGGCVAVDGVASKDPTELLSRNC